MEKINEKRLSVLKVALECLLVVQKGLTETVDVLEKADVGLGDLNSGVKKLEPLEILGAIETSLIDTVIYVIGHLKKPFEETELSEELKSLKKENIDFALDRILERLEKIKKSEKVHTSELMDFIRVLFHLERGMR